jgi:MFS family permease
MVPAPLGSVATRWATCGRDLGRLRWYYGWTIVAVAFCTVGAGSGLRSAFGVLLVPLADGLGWGRGAPSTAIALSGLTGALAAIPLGVLFDRWGPRPVFGGAAVLIGLGLAIAAYTREPWELYLGLAVLVGVGLAPLKPNGQGAVLANWFTSGRGLAVGIVMAGTGVGILLLVPLTEWALTHGGWQTALLALAAVFIAGIAPLNALLQRERPAEASAQGASRRAARGAGPTVGQAVRQRRFWALNLGVVLSNVPLSLLIVHGAPVLVDAGYAPAVVAAQVGLSGVGIAVCMPLLGYLADRWRAEVAFTLGSVALLGALGVLYVVAPGQEVLLYSYTALFALGFASRQGLTASMAGGMMKGPAIGTLMGFVTTSITIGTAIGPLVGGWSFDYLGTYQPALAVSVLCTVVAILCIWLAAPRHGSLVPERPALPASPNS